jgi:hypothetical protein
MQIVYRTERQRGEYKAEGRGETTVKTDGRWETARGARSGEGSVKAIAELESRIANLQDVNPFQSPFIFLTSMFFSLPWRKSMNFLIKIRTFSSVILS